MQDYIVLLGSFILIVSVVGLWLPDSLKVLVAGGLMILTVLGYNMYICTYLIANGTGSCPTSASTLQYDTYIGLQAVLFIWLVYGLIKKVWVGLVGRFR